MIALLGLSALAAGCSGGSAGPNGIPKVSSTNPLSTGKLEFVVGTANLYGTATGLNVVSTYRNGQGLSNVLLDTPTIKGPFTLPAASAAGTLCDITCGNTAVYNPPLTTYDGYSTLQAGPSAQEVAAEGEITATSASLHIGTPVCDGTSPCTEPNATGGSTTIAPNTTTFGQSGGVFVNGLSPGNSTQGGVATSYIPYLEPMYDSSANAFIPFGGPPAFPGDSNGLGLRDGLFNLGAGVLGIPLGISTFEGVTISAGTYSLSLQVPTGNNGSTESYGTVSASATIASTAPLGTVTAPVFTADGNGGGTFAVPALPAGATEEIIEVTDYGLTGDAPTNCQGSIGATVDQDDGGPGPVFYTLVVHGAGTVTLPDTIGPNTTVTSGMNTITPSETLCTAAANLATAQAAAQAAGATAPTSASPDSFSVQAIAADYPLFESLYPNSKSQTPALSGANGQADISISAMAGGPPAAASSSRIRKSIKRLPGFQSQNQLRFAPSARI